MFRFFGGKKDKHKDYKRNSGKTGNGLTFKVTSHKGACDGTASASLAEALIFPQQYNGPTYDFLSFPDELLFIPYRDATIPRHNPANLFSSAEKLNHDYGVTALLIHGNPKNNPTHFMILFHGNGVDLGMASAIWRPLIRALPIHLLIVEYPGYGIMDGRCTCKQVIKVAEHIYHFVTSPYSRGGLNIPVDKLIILGRSIGTGPASHIAKNKCHTLILVSPFTSIHNLSKDLMGKWTKWMLPKDYMNEMDENDSDNNIYSNQNDIYEQEQEAALAPTLEKSVSNPNVVTPKYEAKHNHNEQYDLNKVVSADIAHVESLDDTYYNNALLSNNNNNNNNKTQQEENKEDLFTYPDIAYFDSNEPNKLNENKNKNSNLSEKRMNRKSKHTNKCKRKHKHKRKKQPAFVFNNVTQIEKWQCKHFMVFHGKNDELIPYAHTNTIVANVNQKKPELKAKKFLIDGVGHNDVNIQFIGLRIFMQYQDELQPSFNAVDDVNNMNNIKNQMSFTNIHRLVPYLDNPPQFDIITNKVQNYNTPYHTNKSSKTSKLKKQLKGSMLPSLFDSDSDNETGENPNENNKIKVINEWNEKEHKFNEYNRHLPSKVYHLSLKLKLDAQEKQMQKANDVIATKWI